MSNEILIERDGKILTLVLNRPERKNAISLAMYSALASEINAAADNGTRVIVLHGSGENFTSGNDLSDFANATNLLSQENPITQFIYALHTCPLPVVVAVSGVAVGIGTTLLMHSDMVYADSTAAFRLPFVNLGLCPEFASSLLLPSIAGHVKAAEWLMLGEFFSAADALSVGMINKVVDDPVAVARAQAEKLAEQAPAALRHAKTLMKAPQKTAVEDILKQEFAVFAEALEGAEFREAVTAFFEKRKADFSSFS